MDRGDSYRILVLRTGNEYRSCDLKQRRKPGAPASLSRYEGANAPVACGLMVYSRQALYALGFAAAFLLNLLRPKFAHLPSE